MEKLTWQDIANFFITIVIGYAINIISGKLDIPGWAAALIVAVGIVAVILITRTRKFQTRVGTYNQTILECTEEERENARKGLIVPLSLYNRPETKDLLDQVRDGNYESLDFVGSNLAPFIKAIEINREKITHCWILATESDDEARPGSITYVPALINYLNIEKDIHCEFHYDKTIRIDNDALITQKTRQIVENIFRNAGKFGLQDKDIIADCTGGTKSITLGIFLACLDAERDIQFLGTTYGKDGRPGGPTTPIITTFSIKSSEIER